MECHRCGFAVKKGERIGRQDTCGRCGEALHCCWNCGFYDANAYHECRETEAEWVGDKSSANFCDYFRPGESGRRSGGDASAEARRKLDALFGGGKEET